MNELLSRSRSRERQRGIQRAQLQTSHIVTDIICSSVLLVTFYCTTSSRTSLTHLDGSIELSPQAVIGPTSGSGVTSRGRLGEKMEGRRDGEGAMALVRPHPRLFQDKRPQFQDMRTPQRRRRIKRVFGRLHSALATALSWPAGTPPAETLNTKPYHGCHAKLLASPRPRRIVRRHQGFDTTLVSPPIGQAMRLPTDR